MRRTIIVLIAAPILLLLAGSLCALLAQDYEPSPEAEKHYRAGLRAARDPERAVAELREAVKIDPEYEDAWWALAHKCDPQQADSRDEAIRAWRKVLELTEQADRTRAAESALSQLGVDPDEEAAGAGNILLYVIPVAIVALVGGYFLFVRRREEAPQPLPTISLDFGEEGEPEDLEEALAAAEDTKERDTAAVRTEGDELEDILERLDGAPSSGPDFENLVMRIGAAALTDAAVISAVSDKLIPHLKSSDRGRRLKAFRVLINFEGENERIDSAIESFDRSGFTDEDLGI